MRNEGGWDGSTFVDLLRITVCSRFGMLRRLEREACIAMVYTIGDLDCFKSTVQ